jgi:hypothetical protein
MITRTHHPELRRYVLIVMAGARDSALTTMLYDLARDCPPSQAMDYLEAVELTTSSERDAVIELLERRL